MTTFLFLYGIIQSYSRNHSYSQPYLLYPLPPPSLRLQEDIRYFFNPNRDEEDEDELDFVLSAAPDFDASATVSAGSSVTSVDATAAAAAAEASANLHMGSFVAI